MFETSNRRLEQFLFAHMIKFEQQYKNADGLNVWAYKNTLQLQQVVEEFKQLIESQGSRE